MLGTVQWQHADILLVDKASQYWSHLRGELKAFIYYVHFGHLFYAKRNQQVRDVRLKTDILLATRRWYEPNALLSHHLKSVNAAKEPIPLENTLFYFYSFFDFLALCYLPVLLLFDGVCGAWLYGR